MKNSRKKILAFTIAIAFIGYNLAGISFFTIPKTLAFESMVAQAQNSACEQTEQDCEQEHTDDCSNCETNSHCHSDHLSMPFSEMSFVENQNLPSSTETDNLTKLNYPPEARPA